MSSLIVAISGTLHPSIPMTLTGTIPNGISGASIDTHFTVGGTFTQPVTVSGLPAWLSDTVSGTDIHITGTYPAAGTYPFTINVLDAGGVRSANSAQDVVVSAASVPMSLTGTLPNGTVGATYNGTLTLGGTFVAPVAIDASTGSIPSWMTPSVGGNTVTFTGTAPASAETDTFTVRATDSSATPQVTTSDQVVTVSAAGGVTLVNVGNSANSGTTVNLSVPITTAAGDTILAVLSARQGATNTGPAGFTLVDDYIALTSTSMSEIMVYQKTANGTETSVAATSSRASNGAALQVWKIPGGGSIQTFQGGRGKSGAATSWSVGPFTPPADNAIVIALWSGGNTITEGTYGVDAAWSALTVVDSQAGGNLGTASMGWATQQQTTAAAATANFTATVGVNNPTDYMIAVSA